MTEEEALKVLYQIRLDYAMLPPNERLSKYEDYKKKLNNIKHELAKIKLENRENEIKRK